MQNSLPDYVRMDIEEMLRTHRLPGLESYREGAELLFSQEQLNEVVKKH